MKKAVLLILFFLIWSALFAQQNNSDPRKFALVIGNSNYPGISALRNPVNDADDMETALRDLGFTVEKVLNGDRLRMVNAIWTLSNRLQESQNTYGFFYYAGHGVQFEGENYLIPVTPADNIISDERELPDRAVSLQLVLNSMGSARNILNMIVLDACRDNPLSSARGGSRGLNVVSRPPSGSIIMYATGAGSIADDGEGRNGLFTSKLLISLRNNIANPELTVREVFYQTGRAVETASGNKQIPAIYSQFFSDAYLGRQPSSVQNRHHNIGDRGPAGGFIFYDKGFYSDRWRYLEAAPANTEVKNLEWGAQGYNVIDTQVRIGGGKQNTNLIINFLRNRNENGRAAQVCYNLNSGGFSDWFLPSKDELSLMYENLHSRGLGGFQNARYWSSSQSSSRDAWYIHFGDNGRASNNYAKDRTSLFVFSNDIWTRAIRAF